MISIEGITTDVFENNGSVQACVNITSGTVNVSDYVYAYLSTQSASEVSATGKYYTTTHTNYINNMPLVRAENLTTEQQLLVMVLKVEILLLQLMKNLKC